MTQIKTVHDNNVTMLPINVKLNPKALCNDDILYPIRNVARPITNNITKHGINVIRYGGR